MAAVLAVAAYLNGDGVVTLAALDRALRNDPQHGLACCLAQALQMAVHPDVIRTVLAT